jgi:hypothetical protein
MYVFPIFLGIHRVGHLVESLRLVKSPAEISLLKKCSSITAQGFIKVPRNVRKFTQICLDDMEIEQWKFQNNEKTMKHSDHWIVIGCHGEQWDFQNNEKTMEHSDHWIITG